MACRNWRMPGRIAACLVVFTAIACNSSTGDPADDRAELSDNGAKEPDGGDVAPDAGLPPDEWSEFFFLRRPTVWRAGAIQGSFDLEASSGAVSPCAGSLPLGSPSGYSFYYEYAEKPRHGGIVFAPEGGLCSAKAALSFELQGPFQTGGVVTLLPSLSDNFLVDTRGTGLFELRAGDWFYTRDDWWWWSSSQGTVRIDSWKEATGELTVSLQDVVLTPDSLSGGETPNLAQATLLVTGSVTLSGLATP